MAGFSIVDGKIVDPNGSTFFAKGLNVDTNTDPAKVLAAFPGLTFVRLPVPNYASADSLRPLIQAYTDAGVVVEIEHHPWPLVSALTGADLAAESNWYASVASAFKDNPRVWFGSMNEPQWDGHENITAQQVATYNAIRGTGSNAVILMEGGIGGGDPGSVGAGVLDPAAYSNMTNIAFDLHFYGWVLDDNNTSQSYADSRLLGSATPTGEGAGAGSGILGAQTIHSADGVVPVIIGEFGHSTEANTAEGDRAIQAVRDAAQNGQISGFAAWAWHPSEFTEEWLVDNSGNVTRWGNQLEASIQAAPASVPTPTPTPTPDPTQATTVLAPGDGHTFADAAGNTYFLAADGHAVENGQNIPGGGGTAYMALSDGKVYGQDANSGGWYTWDGSIWTSATAPDLSGAGDPTEPPAQPDPPPADPVPVLTPTSGGELVDGGGNHWTLTTGGSVQENGADVPGGGGTSQFAIVDGAYYGQDAHSGAWLTFDPSRGQWSSADAPDLSGSPVVTPDQLSVALSQDAFNGNAVAAVFLDGTKLGDATVTAAHGGQPNTFTWSDTWGAGPHDLAIEFTNDAYAGPGQDRNLYIEQATYNGAALMPTGQEQPLYWSGVVHIPISQG